MFEEVLADTSSLPASLAAAVEALGMGCFVAGDSQESTERHLAQFSKAGEHTHTHAHITHTHTHAHITHTLHTYLIPIPRMLSTLIRARSTHTATLKWCKSVALFDCCC